jgi:hypothetical protein
VEEALALSADAHAEHDLVSLLPPGDESGDELRRILQVGVQDDRRFSGCDIQTRRDRGLVTEVARQPDDLAP